MSDHPYRLQPDRAYWKKAVASRNAAEIDNWYEKKFEISSKAIATAGSCFAQHIARHVRNNEFNYVDVEPAPNFLQPESHLDYGYGMYSARYGNIYTSRQLLQLLREALGEFKPNESYWQKDGGYVDPFRPTIEPEPIATIEELKSLRQDHLARVLQIFERADVFVFTLGLTETWISVSDGAVYPVAPGVSGGEFDAAKYRFLNLSYQEVLEDLQAFIQRVRSIKNDMSLLFTVSPVPLIATATKLNVVNATSYSKAVLRAVAGYLSDNDDKIDYFPSFEIISSHISGGRFFNPDMRNVASHGVEHVMRQFFAQHEPPKCARPKPQAKAKMDNDDAVCDEELLQAFGIGK